MIQINEGVMLDIMNAYKKMQANPHATYPAIDDCSKFKIKNLFEKINKLINTQINTMAQSYDHSTGLLMSLANVNGKLNSGNYYGSADDMSCLCNLIDEINKGNRERGVDEILEPDVIIGLKNILKLLKAGPKIEQTIVNDGLTVINKPHMSREAIQSFIIR